MKEFHSFVTDDGLTQIEDLCGTKFYLAEGKERAALLDTRYDRTLFCHGMHKRPGFGDIRMIEGGIMLCDLILAGKDRR